MPELPEVETVVRDLRPLVCDRRISAVRVGRQSLRIPWNRRWNPLIVGRRVQSISRRGKWILLHLDDGLALLVHLGMTGQLTVAPADHPPRTHTHLRFTLTPGTDELRFRDIRRFGSIQMFTSPDSLAAFLHPRRLGPEPGDLSTVHFRDRLAATRRCLKAVLLDQRIVAGVGNIYADESLFAARLHPARRACDLSPRETDRLRRAILRVLDRAIRFRGSSIRDYVGGSGLQGTFQDEFQVYGRAGLPCARCPARIERLRLAGRSAHFCPACQSLRPRLPT